MSCPTSVRSRTATVGPEAAAEEEEVLTVEAGGDAVLEEITTGAGRTRRTELH